MKRHALFGTEPNDWYREHGWRMVQLLASVDSEACKIQSERLAEWLKSELGELA